MASAKALLFATAGSFFASISILAAAQSVSNSPFASKKPKAWEVPQAPQPPAPPPIQQPVYTPPAYPPATQYQVPQSQYYPPVQQPAYTAPANGQTPQYQAPQTQNHQPPVYQQQPQYYPPAGQQSPPYAQPSYGQPAYSQPVYTQQTQAPNLRGPSSPYAKRPSWANRMGFGNVETSLSGHAKFGIAAMNRNDVDVTAESIVDLDIRGEVSAITDGGLEYGAGLRVRAQRDRHRRGFGGRVGDCPAIDPACTGVLVGADTRAVKGHTGQFYTAGRADVKETELALEGAYLFLRSSYGDFVLGRDDGTASLFSLGAPSLLAVSASNSPVDYTGLDSVKTRNDASGFAEKIAYTSPRLLGDNIGFGVQVGASFAPNARACGVDYCVKSNGTGATDPFAPQIKNLIELGLSLDRKFAAGLAVELTGTYARGSEDTGNAAFTGLETFGAGLELKYGDWVLGTSYLDSNNGFAGQGDYKAYDIGMTWKPSNWGFSASYGYADDDIAKLTSNQAVLGVSYDIGSYRLGTGVQYIDRKVPVITPTGRAKRSEDALALFVEAGITF